VRQRISRLIVCPQRRGQIKIELRWSEASQLFAIITGVVGALVVLSLLLVLGGYLIVTR
jgi:hypothetical protein